MLKRRKRIWAERVEQMWGTIEIVPTGSQQKGALEIVSHKCEHHSALHEHDADAFCPHVRSLQGMTVAGDGAALTK
jgi:hypothetical protein